MNYGSTWRHPLVERLLDARRVTDELFSIVKPAYLYDRPIRERHRIVFYIGHLEAFDRNLFDQRLRALPSFSPDLDTLFAFGIDPVDGGFPIDQPAEWPAFDAVSAYRSEARAQIDRALASPEGMARLAREGMQTGAPEQLLHVAIEHRLMHAETLAYMLHRLPLEQKVAPSGGPPSECMGSVEPSMVEVPGGPVVLGMTQASGQFGWDNEFGEVQVDVPAFRIDRHMVTNGAWLDFIEAGGYREPRWWKDNDWAWKQGEQIERPAGWSRQNGTDAWQLRTMFADIPLPRDWPVYVSHAEASAYARWRGKALPTEAQWQRAALGAPQAASGNFDFRRWDPQPVSVDAGNVSKFGVAGQFGNGWEWTSTVFDALPGFEAFPFYPGYSANFFDGQHFVLKGGSPRTAQCMLRPTFRNWFQAHYQYAYTGFRCVEG